MVTISRMPIKQKLVIMTVFTSIIGILLVSLSFIVYENHTYKKRLQQELSVIGKMLADRSNAALVFGDTRLLQDNINSLKLHGAIELACIYDDSGQSVARFQRQGSLQCPSRQEPHEGQFTDEHFFLNQEILLEGQSIGALHIRSNLDELRRHLRNYALTTAIVVGLVSLAIWLISSILQRIISTPLLHLAETASLIAEKKDYSLRAVKESDDEIGLLVNSFNDMIETIELQNRAILSSFESLERVVEQRTGELKSANRELEAFSYSVSHDLRQPLRAIDGFSLAILEDCGEQLDDTARTYLDRVRGASQRMGVLIDSMLHLSRVTRQEMHTSLVDLTALAFETLKDLREQEPERKVRVDVQAKLYAKGDERLLRIVMNNLLANAWKYTSKTADAHIEVGAVPGETGETVFYVRDNGAGFDMKYSDKLFQAFHRMHSPNEFEGNGIGLATVFRVIKRHGGKVWTDAKVNEGAAFYFTLGL